MFPTSIIPRGHSAYNSEQAVKIWTYERDIMLPQCLSFANNGVLNSWVGALLDEALQAVLRFRIQTYLLEVWTRGSGSAILFTGQLERRVPELRHEEADRLGEEALHKLVRHALQVPEPGSQKVQQLMRHVKENEHWNNEVSCRLSDCSHFWIWNRKNPYMGSHQIKCL